MGSSFSTSMEPFEINLSRTTKVWSLKNSRSKYRTFEWKLKLPRAFVVRASESIDSEGGISQHYGIEARIDTSGNELVPRTTSGINSTKYKSIGIFMGNYFSLDNQYCVRQDENYWVDSKGAKLSRPVACVRTSNRCSIFTNIDGWLYQLDVSLDLYDDPEKTCSIISSFLEKHTSLRTPFVAQE